MKATQFGQIIGTWELARALAHSEPLEELEVSALYDHSSASAAGAQFFVSDGDEEWDYEVTVRKVRR